MPDLPYNIIVGLEIHVELNTVTKMFCRCLNAPFNMPPNTNICPVCSGLPGTLPVPNQEAVRKTIIMGKALGSDIAKISKWDRKHYFYPDLPKGYQISQYDLPFCVGGQIDLFGNDGTPESTIRFERVHLEEDAGKLLHGGRPGYSNVDLNRAGVPLIEMVSKPDITSAEQGRRLLLELRLLTRTLGISDADMEKGQMRCDVNVNISFDHEGQTIKTPITEIKNVNSTRAVERSISSEAQRQYSEWQANGHIRTRTNKITVGWDENSESIQIQRAKEAANDYRYFPEPDIPPVELYKIPELNPENIYLPELPNQKRKRYLEMGLNFNHVETVINGAMLARFEELTALKTNVEPKAIANWLINASASLALDNKTFLELVSLATLGEVSFAAVKPRLGEIILTKNLKKTLKDLGLLLVHDENVLKLAIEAVLKEQAAAVAQVKAGDQKVLGFLVGQVMKRVAGQAQPQKIQEEVKKALDGKETSTK